MDRKRYTAFISYSHADRRVGERLLRKLQTYRLPKRATPQDSRKLGNIFMDRETLPATGSLTEAIKDGLCLTEALIVICSPSAAQSKWVNKEIEAFAEINPRGPVIAVIIAGDPAARSGDSVCFPAALLARGEEPLAADYRKSGDGPRLGFLKVAASLSGARLETLLQRDATRRRQRVTGITALSAAIALGTSALAAVAVTARHDAEARRAEAEGLVDFMLGDLRDRLEPVGRLDVLDGVAGKALDYYDKQDQAELGCDAVIRKARALHLDSIINLKKSSLDLAETSSQRALDLTQTFLPSCGLDPEFQIAHGHVAFYLGQVAWGRAVELKRSDGLEVARPLFEIALTRYEAYASAISALKDVDGYEQVYVQETADNHTNFGAVMFQLNNLDIARTHFETGRDLIEPLAMPGGTLPVSATTLSKTQKAAIATLANCEGWLGQIDELEKNFDQALVHRQHETDYYTLLAHEKATLTDWNYYRSVLGSQLAIGRIYMNAGRPDQARSQLDALAREAESLVKNDPSNDHWERFRDVVSRMEAEL